MKRGSASCLGLFLVGLFAGPARAWHPATTQAGLAEKAALASRLHQALSTQQHRPLGVFEPITVAASARTSPRMQGLWRRLQLLDPNDGHTPSDAGANTALFWLTAGAVLESTPAERERNHFFDPQSQRGLHDNPGGSGFVHSLRLAMDGTGGLRGLATGTAFDLTGRSALGWVRDDRNELGLKAFFDAWEATASGATAAEREAALADALMCLGGLGAVLGEMGEPAHVRNDFRKAFLDAGGGAGPWDQSSDFERFVSQRYGRAGVPAPTVVTSRPSLEAYFSAPDQQGLADLTQTQFFSAGTTPASVLIDAASTPKQVRLEANRSLTYAKPAVGPLKLREPGRRYQMHEGRRQLAYERLDGVVQFYLDEAVYADTAAAWLPVVAGHMAGLFNDLLRVEVNLAFKESQGTNQVTVNLTGFAGPAKGVLQLYVEDDQGVRRPTGPTRDFSAAAASGPTSEGTLLSPSPSASLTMTLPPGASRVAVSVRGQDAGGAFVGVSSGAAP